ncbi:MAG TPA: 5-(carboxyamino)imidazole ribonucleotide synthase [Hyphomicrobiales bacterium]|nr:5-(carboxyamino)imidazole ribonucleotide synthase [Hyphomicrobiales bacterium]
MPPDPLKPGATIGILGGGQLGRMLAIAAAKLGLKAAVYAEKEKSPAFHAAYRHCHRPYGDEAALSEFAKGCDVVTFEFENVPADALRLAGQFAPVRPSPRAAAIAQDRITEKRFLSKLGLVTAPHIILQNDEDVAEAVRFLPPVGSAILKRAREGYDGKGQKLVTTASELTAAFTGFAAPCVLEARLTFEMEISVIAVRALDGRVYCYDCTENTHRAGILHESSVPARCAGEIQARAKDCARRIADALDYVGVLGVEFFVAPKELPEPLAVNEIAPRVHNSGHWTLDACVVSQFENHIRAIAGWPIGSVARHSDAVMTNLLGEDVLQWQSILEDDPSACLYLYGKLEVRPGRKLGHVTRIRPQAK